MKQIVFAPALCNISFLQPFVHTRQVQDFRIGALTIREKWERILNVPSVDIKDQRLSHFFPSINQNELNNNGLKYWLAANLLPTTILAEQVKALQPGTSIISQDQKILAACILKEQDMGQLKPAIIAPPETYKLLEFFTQIIAFNREALLYDMELLKAACKAQPIDVSNKVIDAENIFIEEGATVRHTFLNAEEGPIFIAKNALVMEGTCLRGPLFVGEKAVIKMGATIYGSTTIGPGCVIGGEVKNTIFFAHSNKAHNGYLGDSIIGEWCNFGAGSSCSNLKNNVANINYQMEESILETGSTKGGVIMGDYSRTAINTDINSGTIIGVSSHVFGIGLTPKIIPNFSWGYPTAEVYDYTKTEWNKSAHNKSNKIFVKYDLSKALKDANAWMQLKSATLNEREKNILTELYNKR